MTPRKEESRERIGRRCSSHHPIYTREGTSQGTSLKATVNQPQIALAPSIFSQTKIPCAPSACGFSLAPGATKLLLTHPHHASPVPWSSDAKNQHDVSHVFKTNSCSFFLFLGLGHNYILNQSPYPCPQPDTELFPSYGFDLFRMQFSVLPRHQCIIVV